MATQKKTTKTAARTTKAKAAPSKKSNGKAASAKKGAKPAKKTATKARVPKPAKPAPVKVAGGPLARLKAAFGSKSDLVGRIVEPLAGKDEDTDALKERLLTASNKQLLRLASVVDVVSKKYGGREQLVASIGKTLNKAKDADYLAKLETLSLPRLLDLAKSSERRAKAQA
jgi:hypothetical protein